MQPDGPAWWADDVALDDKPPTSSLTVITPPLLTQIPDRHHQQNFSRNGTILPNATCIAHHAGPSAASRDVTVIEGDSYGFGESEQEAAARPEKK